MRVSGWLAGSNVNIQFWLNWDLAEFGISHLKPNKQVLPLLNVIHFVTIRKYDQLQLV